MTNPWKASLLVAGLLLIAASGARGANTTIDWTSWQSLPVFDNGRLMPLDTFARNTVGEICGRVHPKLAPPSELEQGTSGADRVFTEEKPRRFLAAELLYEWLVRPEAWERIAFIRAEYEPLRKEVLDVPLRGSEGERLKYVSPRDVERSRELQSVLEEMQSRHRRAERDERPFEMTQLERKAKELYDAYVTYRLVSFNPKKPIIRRTRFEQDLGEAVVSWRRFEPNMSQLTGLQGKETGAKSFAAAQRSLEALVETNQDPDWTLETMEPHAAAFSEATAETARRFNAFYRKFNAQPPDWDAEQLRRVRSLFAQIVGGAEGTSFAAETLFTSLYDNGGQIPLLPSLNPTAVESDTDRGRIVPPWLSFQTVLYGSDAYLRDYPKEPVEKLRTAWNEAARIYTSNDRNTSEVNEALGRFVESVRGLAQAIAPARKKLFEKKNGDALLTLTSYPPRGFTDSEVRYNAIDPFFWSWTTCLGAVVFFALSFGVIRRPMLVLGITASLIAQGWIVWAFTMRSVISGRAPVANMFETIVFVALVVSFLGTWMTIVPLLWNGLSAAWHMTAWPWARSPFVTGREPGAWLGNKARRRATLLFFPLRLALVFFVGYILLFYDPAEGTRRVISITLENGDFNGVMTWIAGMGVLLSGVWFIPRSVLSLLAALWTVPASWRTIDRAKAMQQVDARKTIAVVGAVICFLVSLFAYYAPQTAFNKDINPLMPVLRNNFWLLIHVLTITASYGAGALAWGLSNIAMAYYLFGKYRRPVRPSTDSVANGHGARRRNEGAGEAVPGASPASVRHPGDVQLQGDSSGRLNAGDRDDSRWTLGGRLVGPFLGVGS